MDTKTTSYKLSLWLKELGVEQNGEYYWIDMGNNNVRLAHYESRIADEYDHTCRAFTLGELVRELPDTNFNSLLNQISNY